MRGMLEIMFYGILMFMWPVGFLVSKTSKQVNMPGTWLFP